VQIIPAKVVYMRGVILTVATAIRGRMKHRLTVGVLKAEPGWTILLQQLGVSFEEIKSDDDISPVNYSVVIINRSLSVDKYHVIEEYIKKGGAVLDQGFFHKRMRSGKIRRKRIRSLYPEMNNPVFRSVWMLDIFGTVERYTEASYFNKTVSLAELGAGYIAFIGLDINGLSINPYSKRKQFYSPSGKFPNEIVALVSKGEIRKLVDAMLKWLHVRRNLPYVHKWFFPRQLKNIFCFRLDTDGASPRQMRKWYRIAKDNNIRITWFIHSEPMEGMLSVLGEMDNQEFALHGYYHRTYTKVDENWENIHRNKLQLDAEGFACEGFSAPYGTWNQSLAEAVERHRLLYSSEFSLDYDSFPSFPWLGNRFAQTMQIPIHPVCVGSLIRVKAAPDEMIRYYRYMVDKKIGHREPVIFYDHPLHPYPRVTDEIFKMAREKKMENISFAEFARWWGTRVQATFQAIASGTDTLDVELNDWHPDLGLFIAGDKEETFLNTGGKYSLKELLWKPSPEHGIAVPSDLVSLRKYNRSMLQYALLDMWRRRK